VAPGGSTTIYTHDLWNRLVKVEIDDGETVEPRCEQRFNGLNWRTLKREDTDLDGDLDEERTYAYTGSWHLIEERVDKDMDSDLDKRMQYFWGLRYIDDCVMHRADLNDDGDYVDSAEGTWYHLTDAMFSTVALVGAGAVVAERVSYDSYGQARHHRGGDVNGDGASDGSDLAIVFGLWGKEIGDAEYRAEADLNHDGIINGGDYTLLLGTWGAALPAGLISNAGTGGPDNAIGWDGYVFNPATGDYLARVRTYDPVLGRWLERDPAGYIDGLSMYWAFRSSPLGFFDPSGLAGEDSGECCGSDANDAIRKAMQDLLGILADKIAEATKLQVSSVSVKISTTTKAEKAIYTLVLCDGTTVSGTFEQVITRKELNLKTHFETTPTFGEFGRGLDKLVNAWSALSYMLDAPKDFCDMLDDLNLAVMSGKSNKERWSHVGDASTKACNLAEIPGVSKAGGTAIGFLGATLKVAAELKQEWEPAPFTDDPAVRQKIAALLQGFKQQCGCGGGGGAQKLIDAAEWVREKVPGV